MFFRYFRVMIALESKKAELGIKAHHHLQCIGTHVSMQRKGVASRLISVGIARAEKARLPCYLESSNPSNIPFYERHGFRVIGQKEYIFRR